MKTINKVRIDKPFRVRMHVRLAELNWKLPQVETALGLTKAETHALFYGNGGNEKDSFVLDENYRKAVAWLEG